MSSDQPQTQQQDQDKDQQQEDRQMTEKPEVNEEHQEKAKEMRKEYVEERPTVIMPGSGGTVAGTAVNEWLDEDGNAKFADESESQGGKSAGDSSDRAESDDRKSFAETVEEDKARNERIVKAHDEAAKAQRDAQQKDTAESDSDTKDDSDTQDRSENEDEEQAQTTQTS